MTRLAFAIGFIALMSGGIAVAQTPPPPPRAPPPGVLQPNTPVGPTNPAPAPSLDNGVPSPSVPGTPPLGTVGPLDGLPSTNSGTMNPPPPPSTKPTH